MKKTNAVRILEKYNQHFDLREFAVDENDLSAQKAAALMGVHPDRILKTLVARGDRTGVLIVSLPGGSILDLKALAKLSGNKRIELVPLKDVQKLTGYLRGAVSPLGIKHNYPYYLDQKAFLHKTVIISAGLRGLQIELSPEVLAEVTRAVRGSIGVS